MNSKERVIAAIERRPVDKVPLGLYAIDCDTIANVIGRPTYIRNRPASTIALWEGRYDEVIDSMKVDVVDLYRKLDCVDLLTFKETQVYPRGYMPDDPPRKIAAGLYRNRRGDTYQVFPARNAIEMVESSETVSAPTEYTVEMFADRSPPQLPDKPCESRFEVMDHLIANFGADRYIATHTAGITALTLLGGMEQGLMTLALHPEVVHAANRQRVFRQNELDRYYIRPGADGAFMEQDFGSTRSPLVSPEMFRELCLPYMKARIAQVKRRLPHVLFHSCGNTLPLMEMILEAGIDVYESIQTEAPISVEILSERYGDRLTIWGEIPLDVLIRGTPDDARKAVRSNLEVGRRAPGFILGPSHSIAFGTKYDNFMAMLDEFQKLR